MLNVQKIAALALCAGISAPSFAQATERTLFVTNNQGEPASVTTFRVAADGVPIRIGNFNAGRLPVDCALTPSGGYLVALNGWTTTSAPNLTALKVNADGTLTSTFQSVPVGSNPLGLAINVNNVILVASAGADVLQSFVITPSGIVPVGSAPAGANPNRPVATPDGKFAYCVGPNGTDDIVIFSVSEMGALTRLGAVDVPGVGAFGAAVHPSGDALYVSTGIDNTVRWYAINPLTGDLTFQGSIPLGGNSVVELAINPAGDTLYSAHVLSDTLRVSRISGGRSAIATNLSYLIQADIRDVLATDEFVWVTDESPLGGGQVGVVPFSKTSTGSLDQAAEAVPTNSIRPQFMALWTPTASCPGDSNRDGTVGFGDITTTLAKFGLLGPVGDADSSGVVEFSDITSILANQGVCR
jgi:6-phosphogluconolactonase (cycloisomerase 2 family)